MPLRSNVSLPWKNGTGGFLNATTDFKRPWILFLPLYDSCLIVLSALIIAINVLITVLFVRKRPLRTKTNTLLVSLAISDLCLGFLGIPMSIVCNAFVQFPSMSGFCITASVVYRFIAVSTMFHIFAITIERYVVVIYPFRYVSLVRMSRLRIAIASIWCSSLFIALIQLSWQDFSNFNSLDPVKLRWGTIYNIFGALVCFVIPLCVMIFIYSRIFMVIKRQVSQIKRRNMTSDQAASKAPIFKEIRAVIIFSSMLGIFASCWSTWYLTIITEYYEIQWSLTLYLTLDFLRFAVSFMNPLLYTLMKLDFRKAVKSILPTRCRGNNNESAYLALSTLNNTKNKTENVDLDSPITKEDDDVNKNRA